MNVRQRECAQIEAAQGFIQWLDSYKRLIYDTHPDTDSRDKCWFGTATSAFTGVAVHPTNSVPWPYLSDLGRLAAAAAEDLASCVALFTTEVDCFIHARHLYGTLRVRLDVDGYHRAWESITSARQGE